MRIVGLANYLLAEAFKCFIQDWWPELRLLGMRRCRRNRLGWCKGSEYVSGERQVCVHLHWPCQIVSCIGLRDPGLAFFENCWPLDYNSCTATLAPPGQSLLRLSSFNTALVLTLMSCKIAACVFCVQFIVEYHKFCLVTEEVWFVWHLTCGAAMSNQFRLRANQLPMNAI